MNPKSSFAKIRFHSRLWPLLAILLVFLQLIWPNRAWSTLLIILAGSWLLSFFWTLSLARRIFMDRKMRYGWAQVGDQLEERFTVINDSFLPGLWLEVDDHSNLPGYTAGRVTSIGGNQSMEWKTAGNLHPARFVQPRADHPALRRSAGTLQPGIGPSERHRPAGGAAGAAAACHRDRRRWPGRRRPPAAPRRPGDHRQRGDGAGVCSRATRSKPSTGPPPPGGMRCTCASSSICLLPTGGSFSTWKSKVQVGSGFESTEEHGVILAASLAHRGLREGHSVGLVTCSPELTWMPPQHSSGHSMSILRALALAKPGPRPLSDLLEHAQKAVRHGASLIIITPNVQADWAAALLQLVKIGITPTVLLLDPLSFGGTESTAAADDLLNDYGITHYIIQSDLLNRPEASPGQQGKWEWRVLGRGKAVAVRKPADTGWRTLG